MAGAGIARVDGDSGTWPRGARRRAGRLTCISTQMRLVVRTTAPDGVLLSTCQHGSFQSVCPFGCLRLRASEGRMDTGDVHAH